jgi:uncharacterized protein YecE (DUF72 family)
MRPRCHAAAGREEQQLVEQQTGSRVPEEQIWVGTAGWSYPDWEGRVYPKGTRDKLGFMARHFPLLEVNSSFYAIPEQRTTAGWVSKVQSWPDFRFTVKLFQDFTHRPGGAGPEEVARMSSALDPLRDDGRLGALLVQFPWSFRDTARNRTTIEGIARCFESYRPVVEVRHGSWGEGDTARFLSELNTGWCSIDQPLVGDSLEGSDVATGPVGYVRFHGRNRENWFREDTDRNQRYDYLYKRKELVSWRERIMRIAQRAKQTFVVTNNHFLGQAVVNGLELLRMISGNKVPVPDALAARHPRLEEIRAYPPGSQPGLFSIVE